MQVGIIGLQQSGKTTLFRCLSESSDPKSSIAVVKVPDERVDELCVVSKSKRKVYAQIEFKDVAIHLDDRGAFSKETISEIREANALGIVVRSFYSETVPHPRGSIDAVRDLKEIEDELFLTDLLQIERRIERLLKEGKRAGQEYDLLTQLKKSLEEGRALSQTLLSPDEKRLIAGFRFLSEKPFIIVINADENDRISDEAILHYGEEKHYDSIKIYGKIEEEIGGLDEAEQKGFLLSIGLDASARERFIKKCYSALNLISFLTTDEKETRAWTIQKGSSSLEAAAKVHSDMARGFIRAQVIHFDEFKKHGSFKKAKEGGFLRLEGKEYTVQDGEIIRFRFNV